jgi:hypothetical protein
MANQVTITELLNGPKYRVIHVYISSDGHSGDEADTAIMVPPPQQGMVREIYVLEEIISGLNGFACALKFEYLLSGTFIWVVPPLSHCQDFTGIGGLADRSNAMDGTGKVLLSTVGMGDIGDMGSLVLKFRKKEIRTDAIE